MAIQLLCLRMVKQGVVKPIRNAALLVDNLITIFRMSGIEERLAR